MSFSGTLAHKGALATFSQTTPGTYDPLTGQTTGGGTVNVDCYVMQIDGDPDLYLTLGLIESDNPTLLARPVTPGVIPMLGATVVWGGETLTVKNVKPLKKAGIPTAARVVVSR